MSLRETMPLQKAKILKKSIMAWILLIPIGMLFVLFAREIFENPIFFNAGFLLAVAAFLSAPIYQYFYYKKYYYDINQQMLTIRKGVIMQKEVTLPFSRITDVFIDQDFLDIVFNLCDVHVSTPTFESGLFAHVDGVSKEDGEKLKKIILDYVSKKD